MKYVVFAQKGGVGKSSIAVNLAAVTAKAGFRTLLIDVDDQCNSSMYLLGAEYDPDLSVTAFFQQSLSFSFRNKSLAELYVSSGQENLFVLPATEELANLAEKLESRYKMFKLKEALTAIMVDFDYVFIDTPPEMGFYSRSALIGADQVLIPFDCDTFALQAIDRVLMGIEEIRRDHNPQLSIRGAIVNQYQPRTKVTEVLISGLASRDIEVLQPYLVSSIIMRESHLKHSPLVMMAPKHKLTQQFEQLWQQISQTHLGEPLIEAHPELEPTELGS